MTALRFTDARPGPAPRCRAPLARTWRLPWRMPWARTIELFRCRGCLRWRPWSEGGADDPRCDHCVAAERRAA